MILMLINRWQAPQLPTVEQFMMMLDQEGLEPVAEDFAPGMKIGDHRHPFTEVRVVLEGELLFNVAGNQFLLRAGDRLEIPANTKHWFQCHGTSISRSLYAQRVF
jgi:quercetin dioxygenase-like cupin family protein